MDYKMYILVNKDIYLSEVALSAQVSHAANGYMLDSLRKTSLVGIKVNRAKRDSFRKNKDVIILRCPEDELTNLTRNRDHFSIMAEGLIRLKPGTVICVNIGLHNKTDLPGWISKLSKHNQ